MTVNKGGASPAASSVLAGRLRRDLGTAESYAALLGILIGAGIFSVIGSAWLLTGPGVILGFLVLALITLATSVAYAAFGSTHLGQEPGGEYTNISRTLGGHRVAFLGAWLKIISYVGAEAFLASVLADYLIQFAGDRLNLKAFHLPVALGALLFFYAVHVSGVRWFGRLQVLMCLWLGLSLVVLVVPGLFAVHASNYSPFIAHGWGGFVYSLVPLFFSFAGFESLAQTAGEVKDSTRRLPHIFLRGILLTALIYVLMAVVAVGVLPQARWREGATQMTEVASFYVPRMAWLVTSGAIMAITTSMNSTMLVPSRLAVVLARDGLAARWIGRVDPRTGVPIGGLTLTLLASSCLLISGQINLALNIAIFALMVLYFIHSLVFLLLPTLNRSLYEEVSISIPPPLQKAAACFSLAAMAALIATQVSADLTVLRRQGLSQRISSLSLTSLELMLAWGVVGAALYYYARRWRAIK